MRVTLAPTALLADPEANAMMQAFYSRSKRGIADRLEETSLDPTAIKEKLAKYFIGYGHDSIGQVGYTTFFLEDVSILAAKAIQHNTLYNGQESSTRYISFGTEPKVGPLNGRLRLVTMQDEWISLYKDIKNAVSLGLERSQEPPLDAADYPAFAKACSLKAFDVARGFLPAGVTTNLSWTTSLSTLNRELRRLSRHPLKEVQALAWTINDIVQIAYPSIYQPLTIDGPNSDVLMSYEDSSHNYNPYSYDGIDATRRETDVSVLRDLETLYIPVSGRPKYARLPHHIHTSMFITSTSVIDYGSFRDLQRHRTLSPSSPVLRILSMKGDKTIYDAGSIAEECFNPWYLDVLKELKLFDMFAPRIDKLLSDVLAVKSTYLTKEDVDEGPEDFDLQYYMPLGLDVDFDMQGYLGDWLYMLELRSGETVHPTVRQYCARVWGNIESYLRACSTDGEQRLLDYLNVNVKSIQQDDPLMLKVSYKRAAQDIVKIEP